MEKRELTISYREIGGHVIKVVKIARQGINGYFNQFEYRLIIDNEVKSTLISCSDLGIKNFKNIFNGINKNNIDLLISNFRFRR